MTQLHGVSSFVLNGKLGSLSQVSQHSVKLFALRNDYRNTRIDNGKELRNSIRSLLQILVTYQSSLLSSELMSFKLIFKESFGESAANQI